MSPSSLASTETVHGAITPTSHPVAVDNASSPSVFIPSEFQQQLLLRETEFLQERCEARRLKGPYRYLEGDEDTASLTSGSLLPRRQRSSLSTTTESTLGSDVTEKCHMSTASSQTKLTQRTASSTSLNRMSGSWVRAAEPNHMSNVIMRASADSDFSSEGLTARDIVPELAPLNVCSRVRKTNHRAHASESLASSGESPSKPRDASRSRRRRARTSSLSTRVPPPAGQYALLPRVYINAAGSRI